MKQYVRILASTSLLALALSLSMSSTVWAQTTTTGTVTGTVTDPSNAVVVGAAVALKSVERAFTLQTKTDTSGGFRFELLQPGQYTVTVTAAGFAEATGPVSASVGQATVANIKLALPTASLTVSVTETLPLVQTANANTASTLTQLQVSEVPNPGNDLSYIAQLAPGAVMNTQSGFGNVEFFGLPANSSLFTTNGMDNNDPFLNLNNSGATNLLLGQNDVREVTVVQNGYTAEYGGLGGANINYVTKSGSNSFHGNANWWWSGSKVDANNWFNNATGVKRPFNNVNQYAASLGGPLKKNKIFFFVDGEGNRIVVPTNSLTVIPSTEFEADTIQNLTNLGLTKSIPFYCQNLTLNNGNGLTVTCPSSTVPGVNQGSGAFNLYNGAKGAASALPGSGGSDKIGCSNVVAPSFDPALGTPGHPCALNFRATPNNFTYEYQVTGRVDFNVTDRDQVFVHVTYDVGQQATFTDPINPIFNAGSYQPEYIGQVQWAHTFGPTFTNQMIISAAHYSAIFLTDKAAASLSAFPTSLQLADGSLTTLGGENFVFPQGRNITQYGISDDMTKTMGKHTFKWGVKYRRNDVSDHDFGLFQTGLAIPFSLNDFFNGGSSGDILLQNFARTLNQPMALYGAGGYVEDDWKVRPRLTLTLGLRVEHDSNPICNTLCFASLTGPFNAVSHDPAQPYNQAILINRKHALLDLDNGLVEPRIGLAWQPFASRNVAVRAGYGIFYDAPPNSLVDSFSQNPPLDPQFTPLFDNLAPGETTNLFSDASGANTAFQQGFVTGQTLAQIQKGSSVFSSPAITVADRHVKIARYQKWSLELQYGLGANTVLSAMYVGDHGIHIPIQNVSANAFGFGTLPAAAPDARFAEANQVASAGVSNYHGLIASFKHQIRGGWGSGVFEAHYTYSHAFDDVSNGGLLQFNLGTAGSLLSPQNPNNFKGSYGPADYDVRHSFNANYVWDLPVRRALFGRGWSALVDGWQVAGAVFTRSGLPFTVTDNSEASALNANNFFGPIYGVPTGPITSVNRTCDSSSAAGPNAKPCFPSQSGSNPAFVVSGCETGFGTGTLASDCSGASVAFNQGRNHFRGPKYFDTDFSVIKRTKLHLRGIHGMFENAELGIGAQFFNFFNHPNFDQPVNNLADPKFGTIQRTVGTPTSILGSFLGGDASPRIIQFKAQFQF